MRRLFSKGQAKYLLPGIIGILLYLYMANLLRKYSVSNQEYQLFTIKIDNFLLRGIITQLQMLLSVAFVLLGARRGYLVSLGLNLYILWGSIIFAIKYQSTTSIPGILSYIGVMITISFIYLYKLRLRKQITELREKEKELKSLAYFDGLTNVLNRKTFIEELDYHINFFRGLGKNLYVIFLDVDEFKSINDTMGHHAGDAILQELAARVNKFLNKVDVIGRLGGDELGIIIKHDLDDVSINDYMDKIQNVILKPYTIDGTNVIATVSIGVAEFPNDGIDATQLLKNADIAMYQAKKSGKNQICYYSESIDTV